MDDKEFQTIGAQQHYTQVMSQYFNPLQVVGRVLAELPINPYLIEYMDVSFEHGPNDLMYNTVRVRIDLTMPMPQSWASHMEYVLSSSLQKAFSHSYGKRADKEYQDYDKAPSYFTKEFNDDEIRLP